MTRDLSGVPRTNKGQFAKTDVCLNGHPRVPENLYLEPGSGKFKCRACRAARKQSPRTPTQESWRAMLNRCRYPEHESWKYYGGRGITVCKRWRTFENFLADMGERPQGKTLDRINPDGNYEPGNCRWVTPAEQNANRRPR